MKIKSIKYKFIILITAALLFLSLLIGCFSFVNTNKLLKEDSRLMMNAVCTEQALRLDLQLERIEQAVDALYYCARNEFETIDKLKNQKWRKQYVEKVKKLAIDIANETDGARTIYYRIAPEYCDSKTGFFWVKKNEKSNFAEFEVTDIAKFDKEDREHVGWFYEPKEAKRSIWMSPYYNENVDLLMVSYVVPLYIDDVFIGVVGMDIDFVMFVDLAQQAAVYENGRANLIDLNTKNIYFREKDDEDGSVRSSKITDKLYENLTKANSNDNKLTFYKTQNNNFMLTFQTVRNGMKYILYAPVEEINYKRNSLLLTIVLVTIGTMLLFICFTIYETKKIIEPLRLLTDASSKLAAGDWDVDIKCDTRDEVYTLTNSIMTMSGKLKQYVAEVNRLAYIDGLTGVKNKTCYNDYVSLLKESDGEDIRPYAIVIFDVNNLKDINDNYGHEIGDQYLISASSYICRNYSHSPVFRIGGDEFVVILEGEDYQNRYSLLSSFDSCMKENKMELEPFCPVMIAFGMAEHSEQLSCFEDVFRHADWNMYQKKKNMKDE